jgi:exonuclease SbcC
VRLHRLRVTAFQAFADSEHVDFDALGDDGLFLLHGDTGAGKTTLLDAVCFALYGEVPGARARDARLRSDHADDATRTEVELEATLRERRVRIVRRPRQERPKRRGEGLTEEAAACTVEALGDDGAWTTLAARPEEARAELADLLGMSCEQFCQVVLLPQGEFAAFLRAGSDERWKLLERLFGTERFADVERWLVERRKGASVELREQLQGVRDVVSRLAHAAGEEPPQDWEDEPAGVLTWAQELGVSAGASALTAERARAQCSEARAAAAGALASGTELAERRLRHAAAARELSAWEHGREARDGADVELAGARRAVPVAALLSAATARAREASAARVAAETAMAALDGGAQVSPPPRRGNLRSSPIALREHAAERRGAAGALDALVEVEERVACGDVELIALTAEADTAAETAGASARALESAADERASLETTAAAARGAVERAERLAAEAAGARGRAERATERDRLTGELDTARAAARAAVDAEQAAHGAWLDLRERRLDGMAVELAADLRPGEPCAVCGALEHPRPATDTHGAGASTLAGAAALNAAADPLVPAPADAATPLAERERAAQRAHAAAAEARAVAERAVATVDAALAAAGAVAGRATAEALAADADRCAAELQAAQAQVGARATAERALAQLATTVAAHERARRDAEQAEATARATHAERAALLEADRARVTVARADAPSVAARAAALRAAADLAEAAAAALEHAARTQATHAGAAGAADAAARAAAFADAAAARAAVRDDAQLADLERRLRAFDAGLAERRALAQDPVLAQAAAAPEPDLAGLQARAAAATTADGESAGRHRDAQRRLADVTGLTGNLEAALAALAPVVERERRVRELAALVDGSSASNRLRMRLSAYVLAARLEEVAAAATVRLERMSNGRYALVHSDEGARGRSRGGLELRIVDGWTGRERPPATLSGGETFTASLALALGLADVVAADAGGSRLETLFVDEGFGSLDERTLDEVLDVLDGLREGGRAVGIVSHVGELRQRIPAQLEVVKGRDGSHVAQRSAAVAAT